MTEYKKREACRDDLPCVFSSLIGQKSQPINTVEQQQRCTQVTKPFVVSRISVVRSLVTGDTEPVVTVNKSSSSKSRSVVNSSSSGDPGVTSGVVCACAVVLGGVFPPPSGFSVMNWSMSPPEPSRSPDPPSSVTTVDASPLPVVNRSSRVVSRSALVVIWSSGVMVGVPGITGVLARVLLLVVCAGVVVPAGPRVLSVESGIPGCSLVAVTPASSKVVRITSPSKIVDCEEVEDGDSVDVDSNHIEPPTSMPSSPDASVKDRVSVVDPVVVGPGVVVVPDEVVVITDPVVESLGETTSGCAVVLLRVVLALVVVL